MGLRAKYRVLFVLTEFSFMEISVTDILPSAVYELHTN